MLNKRSAAFLAATSLVIPVSGIAIVQAAAASSNKQSVDTLLGNADPATVNFDDQSGVELGVKFSSSENGTVTGIRFYKSKQNAGTHVGSLYSASGKLLAQAKFSGESRSGWQTVTFATPVSIKAGTQYVAAYYAPKGHYSVTPGGLNQAIDAGPLTAPASTSSRPNGFFAYGPSSTFPSSSYQDDNYWVDVLFVPAATSSAPTTPPPTTTTPTPTPTSPPSTTAPGAPANNSAPLVSGYATAATTYPEPKGGNFAVPASELSVSNGSWSNNPASYSYHWQHCSGGSCSNVTEPGQGGNGNCSSTSFCYVIQSSDAGDTMRVIVTAANSAGTGSATSTATATAGKPVSTSEPVPCALDDAASTQSCWEANEGVAATGCTEAQIEAQSPAQCGPAHFKHVTGNVTITAANTVIDHEWISGCVSINAGADNVVIRDSLIESQNLCQGSSGPTAGSTLNNGNSATTPTGDMFVDSTVDGDNVSGDAYGVFGNDYTALRLYDHGTDKEIGGGANMLILDSLADDLAPNDQCAHANNFWFDSAQNSVLAGSYGRSNGLTSDTCVTATVNMGADYGAPANDVFTGNYMNGYDAVDFHGGCGMSNITMTDNALSTNNSIDGSAWAAGAGNVWSGNFNPGTGQSAAAPGAPSC